MLRDATRILKELRAAKTDNSDDLWLETKEDNIREWIGVLKAPAGTPYEDHYFRIAISIPEGYPIDPPTAKFLTPIFHPNVHFKEGKVCLDILKTEWTPAWNIQSLCTAVSLLLSNPAPESSLNTLAGTLLQVGDDLAFRSMAAMYAVKFAPTVNEMYEKAKRAPRSDSH
jgi:peroxin-4